MSLNNDLIKKIKTYLTSPTRDVKSGFLLGQGGKWLGRVRSWIQFNFINGSDVTWGSHDFLRSSKLFTVSDYEELARSIAEATLDEFKLNLATEEELKALKYYSDPNNWEGNVFKPRREHMHYAAALLHKDECGWDLLEVMQNPRKNKYD